MSRKYTPRRASVSRWLQSAPAAVLDCFDDGPAQHDRFTVFLGKDFMADSPRGFHITYLHSSVDPRGYSGSGEMLAHEAAAFRYRNGRKRCKWSDLPEAVRRMVENWIAD